MRHFQQHFAPILDLLDEGLRLYRRGLASFLLLTALAALPIGLGAIALVFAISQLSELLSTLLILGLSLFSLPLSLYVMGALSRAATMVAADEPVQLRRALAIPPLRLLGMGCYGTVFLFVASMAIGAVTSICFCGFYMLIIFGVFALGSLGTINGAAGEVVFSIAFVVGMLALIGIYLLSLITNAAVYGSTIYALQPFVQEDLTTGAAARHSLDMVSYRIGANLQVFFSASLVFGAATVAVTLALGVLLPLPALFLLGAESTLARAITAGAWVGGLATGVPLLPIWMALLYRRRHAERYGEALDRRITTLEAELPGASARGTL